jgi:hypothetical protein
MRQMLGPVALTLAITGCAGDNRTDEVATDSAEQAVEAPDRAPLCTQLFAPGQTTAEVLTAIGMDTTANMQTGGECTDERGQTSVHLLPHLTCTSGARVWYVNPYGYGVEGGSWKPFPEGTNLPPTDC